MRKEIVAGTGYFGRVLHKNEIQLILVIISAFILRLYLATSEAVDCDEAYSYTRAAISYLQGNWAVQTFHPSFIKSLFAGSFFLFGAEGAVGTIFPWLPYGIGATRLVSMILGTATCLVIYYLVKEITRSHIVAIIPCILLAFDPISMGGSSYGILDPGMTFFYIASILLFYRYMNGRNSWNLYGSAILFGLAIASKYFAVIGIFVFLGILLVKRKFKTEWKSMAVFLWIVVIVFFVVQPPLWSSPLDTISSSWVSNRNYLFTGKAIKPPGNPFIIPPIEFKDQPWLFVNGNPMAAKPDFVVSLSDAFQSPWWYIFYIQIMYLSPFQIIVYGYAFYRIIISILKRHSSDLILVGSILALIPSIFFVLLSIRLPQYAILSSASYVILGSIAFHQNKKRFQKYFLISLAIFHVVWVLCALFNPGNYFTGWGFYITPLTHTLADFFNLMWNFSFAG